MLPSTCFAEDEGTFTNSSRCLNWRWKAADPPGEARTDIDIMADLYIRIRDKYRRDGGKFPDAIQNLRWPYLVPHAPKPEEIAKEINGYAIEDVKDAQGNVVVAAGRQMPSFALLTDDGKTSAGCWIYTGCYTEAGNMMARRDNSDPSGLGIYQNWAFSWPANRRIQADFSYASLRGANLRNADLRNAELVQADLTEADVTGVALDYADLNGATFHGARGVPTLTGLDRARNRDKAVFDP